jgi:uncharacterized membrane protein YqhA
MAEPSTAGSEHGAGASRIVAGSRYLALLSIIPLAIGSLIAVFYGIALILGGFVEFVLGLDFTVSGAKAVIVTLFDSVDLMLIGIALYLVAAGLYQLFVRPGSMPGPLRVTSVDELKDRLLGVLVTFLVIFFVGEVTQASLEGTHLDVPQLGASIALVIVAVSGFLWVHSRRAGSD